MYILLIILFSRFVGGEMNTCYNCVDRHVENGFGHQTAIIHDSPVTNVIHKLSYQELLEQVLHLYYWASLEMFKHNVLIKKVILISDKVCCC